MSFPSQHVNVSLRRMHSNRHPDDISVSICAPLLIPQLFPPAVKFAPLQSGSAGTGEETIAQHTN